MCRFAAILACAISMCVSTTAFAGGGGGPKGPQFDWKNSSMVKEATAFVKEVSAGSIQKAYELGGENLRKTRQLDKFKADVERMGLVNLGSVEWENGIPALPVNNGYKLTGTFKSTDGKIEFPVYLHLEGDVHLDPKKRNRDWINKDLAAIEFVANDAAIKKADASKPKPKTAEADAKKAEPKPPKTVMDWVARITHRKGSKIAFSIKAGEVTVDGKVVEDAKAEIKAGATIKIAARSATKWSVLDYRSARSMFDRLEAGAANGLDYFLLIFMIILALAFLGMIWTYIRGLRGSPRELYLMFFTKVTEYSAYGAAAVVMVKYLSQDVLLNGEPLGDTDAYLFYGVWTLSATIIAIMVGSVCDTIGIKKCLLIGAVMLLTARFVMPLSQDLFTVALLGFLPLAFGFAITGPVLKVGIKKFTTIEGATLGFGLFYTLMNVGFWIGAELADWFRATYSDTGTVPFLGLEMLEMTTYQAIIAIGFLINIPDFIAILIMREGAEMTENGFVIHEATGDRGQVLIDKLRNSVDERREKMKAELIKSVTGVGIVAAIGYAMVEIGVHTWKVDVVPVGRYIWALYVVASLVAAGGILYSLFSILGAVNPGAAFDRVMKAVRDATEGTIARLKENFTERAFWVYMGMLAILVFVRLTFYIFHVMFPTYAIRVFGADFPVGSIFGALNPAMIIFLVPLIALLTTKIRSYTMLLVGTLVSAGSVFLCFMPDSWALAIGDSWFGTWVLDYWLEAPEGNRDPFLISLVVFIVVFTVGEALWSPRLMQFSAEIAPRGKEGAYIALAMLPYFLGKMGATIVSEQVTTRYFNASQVTFPDHTTTWLVIGSMAMLSPIGLLIFRKTFNRREVEAAQEARDFAASQADEKPDTAEA